MRGGGDPFRVPAAAEVARNAERLMSDVVDMLAAWPDAGALVDPRAWSQLVACAPESVVHKCPFRSSVHGDETPCACDDERRQECSDDI
jgi:hypothetical protein